MSFVRENIIRNKSMKLYEDPNKDAATHFIKGCQENELKYTNLRRDLPSVFVDLKDYIQEVETE